MLDNNTNKVVWVGVAVGVVTLVGAGALLLFPQITDNFKPMMRESMLTTQATPNALLFSPEKDLTYADNYNKTVNAYYYFLTKKSLEVKPNTYVYYGADLKVNKDSMLVIDVSNYTPTRNSNDNDDVNYRQFSVKDSDGNEINGKPYLKAGKLYHIMIKYRNSSDVTIYDKPYVNNSLNGTATALAFRPAGGVKVGNDLHVSVSNYKVNMVHF